MALKKHIVDLQVVSREELGDRFVLLKCTDANAPLPPMMPGQFAQLRVCSTATSPHSVINFS